MAVRVAINGFGRIGRLVLRSIIEHGRTDIEVVAINDLGPVETNAHLLRFDSVHGRFPANVKVDGDKIVVRHGAHKVRLLHPRGYDYFVMLRRKLHWSTNPLFAGRPDPLPPTEPHVST